MLALLAALTAYSVVDDIDDRRAAFFVREATALAVAFDRFGFIEHAEMRRYVVDDRFTADEIAVAAALIARQATAFGVDDLAAIAFVPSSDGRALTATQTVAGVTVGAMRVSKRADSIAFDGHFWPGVDGASVIDAETAAAAVVGALVEITGGRKSVKRDVQRDDVTLTLVPYLRLHGSGVTDVRFAWRVDVALARMRSDSGLECGMFHPCKTQSRAPQAIDAISGRGMPEDLAVCMPRTPPRPGAYALAWCK